MPSYFVAFGISKTGFKPHPDHDMHQFLVENIIIEMSDPPTALDVNKLIEDAYTRHPQREGGAKMVVAIGLMSWNKLA